MSTEQTDMHHANQETIFEEFAKMVDEKGYVAGKVALEQMTETDHVDPKTYKACKEYLLSLGISKEEDDGRGRELQEQSEERHRERMDEHFAPSEGPVT